MRRNFEEFPLLGRLLFALALVLAATFADSQVTPTTPTPVAMAPPLHFQFLNAQGQPLANGHILTYAAGTTTCLNTYVDATGTGQNPCSIPLDSTGSPSNGSQQVSIFLANNSYKFVAYDVNNNFQWSVDQVASYFGLLNSSNLWTAPNIFADPITILATDQQIILGSPGGQTTLDFPPATAGPITLEFPATGDTMVGRNTVDTLTNKNLTIPQVNGIEMCQSPGAYQNFSNWNSPGTTLWSLVTFYGGGANAGVAPAGTTGGIAGIACANAGSSGLVTVQMSGGSVCNFDGATTANDYVQMSPTVAGDCHDVGSTYPASGQVLGRVNSTNGTAGLWGWTLFGPEIRGGLATRAGSFAAGTGAGTGGTLICQNGCLDIGGQLSVDPGTSPAASGTVGTLTFGNTGYKTASCTISPANSAAALLSAGTSVYIVVSPSFLVITSGTSALTQGTIYLWDYVCNVS